jgi:chemotaxis protein histidine kinase CheA/ActR/RegA family two-component response regulator
MQPEQQRIMVYFIEEAKEHLNTIEHGLLNLQSTLAEPEMLNDVFRAAHSVKGGAAMLGIHSMQHIAHRLEDYFKVLKEHPIEIDQKLESLFFQGFDALSALTVELESSFTLAPDISEQTIKSVEPAFNELHHHLVQLVGPSVDLSDLLHSSPVVTEAAPVGMDPDPVCLEAFQIDVLEQIRVMLELFKHSDSASHRQELQKVCQGLEDLGQAFQVPGWTDLVEKNRAAIADPHQSWETLAQVVVPELKAARDLVLDNRATEIAPSSTLLALLSVEASSSSDDWLGDLFTDEPTTTNTDKDLNFLLDDLLQEPQPEVVSVSESEALNLSELLTAEPQPVPVGAAPAIPTFDDLEQLLDEPQVSPVAVPQAAAPQASRRVGGNLNQTMKVPVKQLDKLSDLVGELLVSRNTLEDGQDRLRQFLDNLLFQVQQLNDLGQKMEDLYERSLLEGSLLSAAQASSGNGSNGDSTHATGADFDALEMDSFTGFHTLSQEMIERIVRVREAASDIEFVVDSTEQVTRIFRQVTTQVQEGLTKSRMVPFGQVAERLPRAVRDISLKCGKQARLELEGQDTLVDKSILERLYDPLTHLVNNAIFHGIEYPDVRQSIDKETEGLIKIRAFYQGNQTIISITDDGAGIDPERVKAKALQKNLITPEQAKTMSRQDAYGLLFMSGFTTQDKVTDLAGRGVGMDVVRSSITDIRGVINTDSGLGKGTTFTIRLPLTLSITKALCCENQNAQIAFPMDGVQDVIDVPKAQLQSNENGQVFVTWQDRQLLCKPLGELLTYNRRLKRSSAYSLPQENPDQVSIVILRSGDERVAIQVDQVLGEQEIVIKQLGGPAPKPLGIAGVTVKGDGRIMPIADVLELLDLSFDRIESTSSLWANSTAMLPAEEELAPMVLIVDDSITVRELLSMTFNKVGYRVEQARDGMEAWEKLRSGLPCDLVFCDVEMPRMDGLELLSKLQQDDDLNDLPVAMLTSRGATKHKQMAMNLGAKGYFTKPYLEEALLDAANRMLRGEVLIKV